MVKPINSVGIIAVPRQDDALQSLRESIPFRDNVEESLHVSFGDDMNESTPGRLAVENKSLVRGGPVAVLALYPPRFDLGAGASVERGSHKLSGSKEANVEELESKP